MPRQTLFRIEDPARLAETLAVFDRMAHRRHGELFAGHVADEVTLLVDRHRCGLNIRDEADCPLKDAVELTRRSVTEGRLAVGSRMAIRLLPDCVELEIVGDQPDYSDLLANSGCIAFDRGDDDAPAGDVPMMAYRSLRAAPPTPKWTSVRNRIASSESRIERMAGEIAASGRTSRPDALAIARRKLCAVIGRDELRAYGKVPVDAPAKTVIPRHVETRRVEEEPSLVDHADIVTTLDDHIFVAIMDSGLSRKNRLMLLIGPREIAFAQGGRDFGTVVDVPRSSLSALRLKKFVSVVEMTRGKAHNEIKMTHMAQIRDLSTDRDLSAITGAWRSRVTSVNEKAEQEWVKRT